MQVLASSSFFRRKMEVNTSKSHQQRKMEAKLQKRQRIEQSGGIRPRLAPTTTTNKEEKAGTDHNQTPSTNPSMASSSPATAFSKSQRRDRATVTSSQHRFGRVMEHVPCRNVPRYSTLSIAIPSSILYNCQTRELKTILCGQIARAATIYHVDEIIIYNDGTLKTSNRHFGQGTSSFDRNSAKRQRDDSSKNDNVTTQTGNDDSPSTNPSTTTATRTPASDPQILMARILQYCECPQYLRKHFFPIHNDLQFSGLLAPIDAPHHVRADDRCKYREGVVLTQQPAAQVGGSLVNCGIRNRPVLIDQRLQPGIRCTVELDPAVYGRPGQIHGKVISPSTIARTDGTYWGYTVRIASSMKAIFDECPYPLESGGYDLTIGTSERGNENIDDPNFSLQQRRVNKSSGSYRHGLIVFGGVAGIEESIDADESMPISGSLCHNMFDKWINICPYQGSRTIRSEEAVLITLAKLSPLLTKSAQTTSSTGSNLTLSQKDKSSGKLPLEDDEQLSEESSDEDDEQK